MTQRTGARSRAGRTGGGVASVRTPCDNCGGECEGAAAVELALFFHPTDYRRGVGPVRTSSAVVCGTCSLLLADLMPAVFISHVRNEKLNPFQTTDALASSPHSETAPGRKGHSDTPTS
jgi:hypothetical protein